MRVEYIGKKDLAEGERILIPMTLNRVFPDSDLPMRWDMRCSYIAMATSRWRKVILRMARELRNWVDVLENPDGGEEQQDDGENYTEPNPNALSISLYFHGACEPTNPKGTATYGWWVADHNNACLGFNYAVVGTGDGMTNHVADYHGLGFGLQAVSALSNEIDWDLHKLIVCGSNQLVVNQVEGVWKCNSERLRPLKERCEQLIVKLYEFMPNWVSMRWVGVEQNRKAAELSKRAYDTLPHDPDKITDQTISPATFGNPVVGENT